MILFAHTTAGLSWQFWLPTALTLVAVLVAVASFGRSLHDQSRERRATERANLDETRRVLLMAVLATASGPNEARRIGETLGATVINALAYQRTLMTPVDATNLVVSIMWGQQPTVDRETLVGLVNRVSELRDKIPV